MTRQSAMLLQAAEWALGDASARYAALEAIAGAPQYDARDLATWRASQRAMWRRNWAERAKPLIWC